MQPKYQYQIQVQSPGKNAVIIPFSEATWTGSRQEAKRTLSVKTHQGRDRFWPDFSVKEGDIIQLVSFFTGGPQILFTGMVVEDGRKSTGEYTPVAYDFGSYLTNNDVVIITKGEPADRLLTRMFQQVGIDIGGIGGMPWVEKQSLRGKKLWDAVVDILNQIYRSSGIRYWCWIEDYKVFIGTQRGQTKQWRIAQGSNLLNAQRKRSIADMRTAVRVIGSDNESGAILYQEVDQENIKKFGQMVKVIELQENSKQSAVSLAKQELKNVNRVKDQAEISSLGLDDVISGSKIDVYEEMTGLKGIYTVFSDSHTIRPGYHEMKLDLQMEG